MDPVKRSEDQAAAFDRQRERMATTWRGDLEFRLPHHDGYKEFGHSWHRCIPIARGAYHDEWQKQCNIIYELQRKARSDLAKSSDNPDVKDADHFALWGKWRALWDIEAAIRRL